MPPFQLISNRKTKNTKIKNIDKYNKTSSASTCKGSLVLYCDSRRAATMDLTVDHDSFLLILPYVQ